MKAAALKRVLLVLLLALSLPVLAQLECNPSAPRIDPGTGFVPFATLERLEVRSGRLGAADWEWGLGVNTQSAGQFVTANLDWVNDKVYDWTLSYSGTGSATMEVRDGGTLLFTRTWASGMDAGNALKFYVKSSSGIPVGTKVTATSATLNGQPAAGMLQTAGTGDFSEAALYWFYPPMSQGFTATGTVKLTFSGSYPPTGSRLNFIVTAGNIPCTAPPAQAKLYYIHVDHLNTPRLIADDQQRTVWRWDNTDPFGGNPPDENPSGLGTFEFPLRFPGQYFDKETNLHYNYFRDYDPGVGRYGESDPIGLDGGLNTYSYVGGTPLTGEDPFGLAKFCCRPLDSFVGRWPISKRHCYVVADDGTRYSLFPRVRGGVRVGVPQINVREDPADARSVGGECLDCPSLDCIDQNSCLKTAFSSYPIGRYAEFGPNSNTFAGKVAQQCCRGGVPTGVNDAPGISASPPSVAVPAR